MTTDQSFFSGNTPDGAGELTAEMQENLAKVEELSERLVAAMAQSRPIDPSLQGPGGDLIAKASGAAMAEWATNPGKIFEQQVSYWAEAVQHFSEAQQAFLGQSEVPKNDTTDGRFKNPLWDSNPYFAFVKEQYLRNVETVHTAMETLDDLDPKDQKRLKFFTQQILDLFAPTNFLATNPDALTRALETQGQSLVDGLANLVRDLEANDGNLLVSLADKDAFKVGENLGTTPGGVVFRNRMFELVQYAPTTEKVHKTPLILFPPWINKFYILDLKEKNSLIKWITDQGFTLFVVSWVNPDASYRDVSIDTYIEEGYLTAISEVKRICDVPKVNVTGYCIAGTTLSATLALMKKRGDTSVKSATFFTTLTDFSDQGEVGVFLDDGFVDGIARECDEQGVLDSFFMSRTFSFLRSNDLIYGPAIRSYMMGEAPPAFDLLFWNGDGTNLPAAMTVQYLRELCQQDRLARGEFEILGERLNLRDISVPICAIACETDHIAAWRSSYRGMQHFGSRSKTFILSESGHIAGIVNPPSKKKYGHYTNSDMKLSPEAWQDGADFHAGSWWPRWGAWLAKQSGAKIAARQLDAGPVPVLCAAPGSYVVENKS